MNNQAKITALRDLRSFMLKEDAKRLNKKEEDTKGTMKGEGPPPIMLRILELKGKNKLYHKPRQKDED